MARDEAGSKIAGPLAVAAVTAAFAQQEATRPPPHHALAATVLATGRRLREAGLHPRGDETGDPGPLPEPSLASVAALKAGASGEDGLSFRLSFKRSDEPHAPSHRWRMESPQGLVAAAAVG
eukprot:360589-Chlamydomonas_euryale.AAC.1